ncbi:MAG: hypothetical protein H6553_00575 [Chitinophagales bacterium]|nr:hypothetical protein [Chitinophagales bacterium]
MKYTILLFLLVMSFITVEAQLLWSDEMDSKRTDKIYDILYADSSFIYYYNVSEPLKGYGYINRDLKLKSISRTTTDFQRTIERDITFEEEYNLSDIAFYNNTFVMMASIETEKDNYELSLVTLDTSLEQVNQTVFENITDETFEYHLAKFVYLKDQIVLVIERTLKGDKYAYKNDDHKELMLYYFDKKFKLIKKEFYNYDNDYGTTNWVSITSIDNEVFFILKEFVEPENPKEKNYFAYVPKYKYSIYTVKNNELKKLHTLNPNYYYNEVYFTKSNNDKLNVLYTIKSIFSSEEYIKGVGALILNTNGDVITNRNFAINQTTLEQFHKKEVNEVANTKHMSPSFKINYTKQRKDNGFYLVLEYFKEIESGGYTSGGFFGGAIGGGYHSGGFGNTSVIYNSYANVVFSFDDSLSLEGISYLPKEQTSSVAQFISCIYTTIDNDLYLFTNGNVKKGFSKYFMGILSAKDFKDATCYQMKVTPNQQIEIKEAFKNEGEKSLLYTSRSYINDNILFIYSNFEPFAKFKEKNPRLGIYHIQ